MKAIYILLILLFVGCAPVEVDYKFKLRETVTVHGAVDGTIISGWNHGRGSPNRYKVIFPSGVIDYFDEEDLSKKNN